MMKKWLSICVSVVLLLSLTACGGGLACDPLPLPEDADYRYGMEQLELGNLAKAYGYFKASTDPKAAEVLEKFAFVPTTVTYKESRNSADYTDTFTYDERGNLLEDKSQGKTNWYTKKDSLSTYTYDEDNRLLSHTYHHPDYGYKETYTYDEDGNRLSYYYYDSDGTLTDRTVCTYDERGNLLTKEEYADVDDDYRRSTVCSYDEQDRLTTRTETYGDGEPRVYTYAYAADGSYQYSYTYARELNNEMVPMTTICYYDSEDRSLGYKVVTDDGTVCEQEEIRLNENGDETYRRMLYNLGEGYDGESVTVYTYNEMGKMLTRQATEDGEITSATTYTYDEMGNPLTYDYFSGSTSWGRKTYTYDEQGHLLTRQEMGQWGWTEYTLSYDEKGNCIKEEKNGHESDSTSEYTYDEWGNRIGCTYYGTDNDGGAQAINVTAAWELQYYPDGVPHEVYIVTITTNDRLNG